MSLRINHNTTAINTHRNLLANDAKLAKSLERLSSGLKINRAADGAAALIISEQMRAQISGIKQAIDNSETGIGMIQTAEGALTEVNNLLVKIRQLAIHAANEGANDEVMLLADQFEIDNALETIDRMTNNTQFGQKKLLDGSQGANGVANGRGLEFVSASPRTSTSPVEGYVVRVQQLGSRAFLQGEQALTQDMVDAGEEITLSEGGKTLSFRTRAGDSVAQTIGKLANEITQLGLDLTLTSDDDGVMRIMHNKFGSEFGFTASSTTSGILSESGGLVQPATSGMDVQGTVGGSVTIGRGQTLTGAEGTPAEGLLVRYTGEILSDVDSGDNEENAGRVVVKQNSLVFQVGANAGQTVRVSLQNTNTRTLGRGVANRSDFQSLRDVNVLNPVAAQDTLALVDKAINDTTKSRASMGAFQKNTLESNLQQLRITAENLISAESTIRDTDMAIEVTNFTRNNIMVQAATAMLAQANQTPQTVLSLLQ